ncbi:MAG TPA: hypothetical protein VLB74_04765 [Flavobacterium sp.]|uniref:hypothetical protein n=1 Tax=Flavobacterium sp. TaxID=239 RepID=UPI002CC23C48|nr:hypothetical protein [Flavobacterium sp.]HSD13939.1 hypothetical protein [Flavobacterium sp.]
MEEEAFYVAIGSQIEGAEKSQMFGKPCFKINGKAFVCFFQNEMVFKLNGDFHSQALSLEGAQLFDPSGKGRAMKEWVQVPFRYSDKWKNFAMNAAEYVGK